MHHRAVDSADSLRYVMNDGLMRTTTRLFDAFWAAGISNPLEIVDQISHLLYLRELDSVQERWTRGQFRRKHWRGNLSSLRMSSICAGPVSSA
jgi:hypothetical protein